MPSPSANGVLRAAESQWIFTVDEFRRTPSRLDGLSLKVERESRGKGVHFITQVGIMLKLPQMTLSAATIYFHRFFMRYSMVDKLGRPAYHYYVGRLPSSSPVLVSPKLMRGRDPRPSPPRPCSWQRKSKRRAAG